MIVYLDTSIVLRFILGQPQTLKEWKKWKKAFASELMGVEARRTLDRYRLIAPLEDENLALAHDRLIALEESIDLVSVTRSVLQRASLPMPTTIKTLDAIHLATALLYRESTQENITFATHDEKLGVASRSLDFSVIGVTKNS